jgi:hypothetical protein
MRLRYTALYTRAPDSLLLDSIFVPFLPRMLTYPLIVCFCQDVAAMISSSVAPFAREWREARLVRGGPDIQPPVRHRFATVRCRGYGYGTGAQLLIAAGPI